MWQIINTAIHPISVNPIIIKALHSTNAALFLSHLLQLAEEKKDEDGWINLTNKQITETLGLTRTQQNTARKILKGFGLIEEKTGGHLNVVSYKINKPNLESLLKTAAPKYNNQKIQTQIPTCTTEHSECSTKTTNCTTDKNTFQISNNWQYFSHQLCEFHTTEHVSCSKSNTFFEFQPFSCAKSNTLIYLYNLYNKLYKLYNNYSFNFNYYLYNFSNYISNNYISFLSEKKRYGYPVAIPLPYPYFYYLIEENNNNNNNPLCKDKNTVYIKDTISIKNTGSNNTTSSKDKNIVCISNTYDISDVKDTDKNTVCISNTYGIMDTVDTDKNTVCIKNTYGIMDIDNNNTLCKNKNNVTLHKNNTNVCNNTDKHILQDNSYIYLSSIKNRVSHPTVGKVAYDSNRAIRNSKQNSDVKPFYTKIRDYKRSIPKKVYDEYFVEKSVYGNVKLTGNQYSKLVNLAGQEWVDKAIVKLNNYLTYCQKIGKDCKNKSHFYLLLWEYEKKLEEIKNLEKVKKSAKN